MGGPRILISAGEASGDLHAAHLVREVLRLRPDARFFGMGGERMAAAGVERIVESRDVAVTGLVEVAARIGPVLRGLARLRRSLEERRPDLVVLVDFPDFNLRLARAARKRGIPSVYYIAPQVWAWRRGRARLLRGLVEKVLVILPFEKDLYGDKGVFVGHPLLDEMGTRPAAAPADPPCVALLPGSRENEVRRILPVLLEAAGRIAARIPEVTFFLPVASTAPASEIRSRVRASGLPVRVTLHGRRAGLAACRAAVVASGTATLETALLGVPMVIVYRMAPLSYVLARRLVRVPHVGLINMVAGERIVPELLQGDATSEGIAAEIAAYLEDPAHRRRVSEALLSAAARLGGPGASARAAAEVVGVLEGTA